MEESRLRGCALVSGTSRGIGRGIAGKNLRIDGGQW